MTLKLFSEHFYMPLDVYEIVHKGVSLYISIAWCVFFVQVIMSSVGDIDYGATSDPGCPNNKDLN